MGNALDLKASYLFGALALFSLAACSWPATHKLLRPADKCGLIRTDQGKWLVQPSELVFDQKISAPNGKEHYMASLLAAEEVEFDISRQSDSQVC